MILSNQKWLIDQLNQMIQTEPKFKSRALLERTRDLVNDQYRRLQQARDELDGRIWDHENW